MQGCWPATLHRAAGRFRAEDLPNLWNETLAASDSPANAISRLAPFGGHAATSSRRRHPSRSANLETPGRESHDGNVRAPSSRRPARRRGYPSGIGSAAEIPFIYYSAATIGGWRPKSEGRGSAKSLGKPRPSPSRGDRI